MKDQKEIRNQVADHLSLLEKEAVVKFRDELIIDNNFPNEQVLEESQKSIPSFAYFDNY